MQEKTNKNNIRNFVIIAHIDHGKSTLADRMLEISGAVEKRKMKAQYLDNMDLERERGITIKMRPVRMNYKFDNQEYILNLIDTPGHVDFSYEVSRSLAAVEGAILLVDAVSGIQAQTLANYKLALDQGLVVIPIINKVDLPNARVEQVEKEIESLCGIDKKNILKISAKTGEDVEKIFEKIIKEIPSPAADASKFTRALIFDSFYDNHKGTIAYIRVMEGKIKKGQEVYLLAGRESAMVSELGFFRPELVKEGELQAGEIGYIATGLKDPEKLNVGDTVCLAEKGERPEGITALSGYKIPKPMVFASIYPSSESDFDALKKSLDKLKLNDSSLSYQPESFATLGRGFSAGFLGMLHLEIVKERLSREYGLDTILTTPSVSFKVEKINGEKIDIFRASDLPEEERISKILEPWVKLEILAPQKYFGPVMKLVDPYRLVFRQSRELSGLVILEFEAPLMEIISDFYDKLKSVSQGFASMNYEMVDFRAGDLVKLDFLIAGDLFPAFSRIVPKVRAEREGRSIALKLKDLLPRENFTVAIQAAIGSRIVARETIPALRKDVTGYLYGGDRTRRMKLWKKQKEGKKRMKEIGRVRVPARVYLEILKRD